MNTYTMKDWERDGSLKIVVGQEVSDEVVIELRNALPPTYNANGIVQPGEAYDSDLIHPDWCLYQTFERNQSGNWTYKGLCFEGKTEPRKGYIATLYTL